MSAQTRWENQRDIDAAEHNQASCRNYPDCSCDECHTSHLDHGYFNEFCVVCDVQKCPNCNGTGLTPDKLADCPQCLSGRIR